MVCLHLLWLLVDRFKAGGGEAVQPMIANQNDGDPLTLQSFEIASTPLRFLDIILLERNFFLNKKLSGSGTDAAPLGTVQDDPVRVASEFPLCKRPDLGTVVGIDLYPDLTGLCLDGRPVAEVGLSLSVLPGIDAGLQRGAEQSQQRQE